MFKTAILIISLLMTMTATARTDDVCPICRGHEPQLGNCPVKDRWCNDYERAGCPQDISCFARPSILPNECGYYVGGGAHCKAGEIRYCNEGLWGWDYLGMLRRKKVALNWYHGEKYQGGTGAYKTDGPKCEKH